MTNTFNKRAACALAAGLLMAAHTASAQDIQILGERIFPESLTSAADGTVYFGSIGLSAVLRAQPGAASTDAEPWIATGVGGLQSVLGVFADDASNTLWVCSIPANTPATPNPPPSALLAFDLSTGAPKGSYELPTAGGRCNDIAVDAEGAAYATDTPNMELLRLAPGGTELEVWVGDGAFGATGDVLDGVAVLGDRVFVNALATSKLFAVDIEAGGAAGEVVEITLDRPISRPDGMRSTSDNELLIVEGGESGRLSHALIDGDSAKLTTLKEDFPGGAVAVTVVGETAYVVEAQFAGMRAPAGTPLLPFRAIAVPLE